MCDHYYERALRIWRPVYCDVRQNCGNKVGRCNNSIVIDSPGTNSVQYNYAADYHQVELQKQTSCQAVGPELVAVICRPPEVVSYSVNHKPKKLPQLIHKALNFNKNNLRHIPCAAAGHNLHYLLSPSP